MPSLTSTERRSDVFRYLNPNGELVAGIVWAPGPGPRTLWVLPASGARAADAVVVKLAKRLKGGSFDGEHRQASGWERPPSANWSSDHQRLDSPAQSCYEQSLRIDHHFAPKLSEADWRGVVGPVDQLAFAIEDAA